MVCSSTKNQIDCYNGSMKHENHHNQHLDDCAHVNHHKTKLKGWILSREQMEFIRTKPYMYNCYVSSVLELLFLQKYVYILLPSFIQFILFRFWFKLSNLVPIWVSPCVLTIIGFLINVLCTFLIIYHSPDAHQAVS